MVVLSIVVPVYGVEEYLDECVSSLVKTEVRDLEIILVDDGSPDECPQKCDEWKKKDSRIKVIHKENGGLSDARNAGMSIAKGDYIWFVDSDDWVSEESVSLIMTAIKKNQKVDIFAAPIMEYKDGIVSMYDQVHLFTKPSLYTAKGYYSSCYPLVPIMRYVFRRSFLKDNELLFFKGVLHEDIPFAILLMYCEPLIMVLSTPMYYYRIRQGSITQTASIKNSCSLVEGYKRCMQYLVESRKTDERDCRMSMMYDMFHEIFIKLAPFVGKKEYSDFMSENAQYISVHFKKVAKNLSGKRKALYYVYRLSPAIFAKLLYWKKEGL